ncbi:MAG: type IV pilus assembly protein PilP [Lysobacterales bacterium]|jgi:type IV pilus assembly protein PilP
MNGLREYVSARGLILTISSALLLSACGGEMNDLTIYIEEVKQRQADPIPPIPSVKTYSPYTYEGQTGRDPFRQSTSEGSDDVGSNSDSNGPKPDANRVKEYLERFELDTLAMVGTLAMDGNHWSLIRDPDGVVHRVPVDSYLGRNHGRVTSIRETQVSLSELITDGLGGWLIRDASILVGEG